MIIIAILLLVVFIFGTSQLEREIPYKFHNDDINIKDVNFENRIRNLIEEEISKFKVRQYIQINEKEKEI